MVLSAKIHREDFHQIIAVILVHVDPNQAAASFIMSESETNTEIPRAQLIAIRQARRYLKGNNGTLARILNAYKSASETGSQLGFLPER